MRGSVLVMAKAPVAGRAKTRLAAAVGPQAAAELAAAALLDTLDAGAAAYPAGRRVLALTGELADAARSAELRRAAEGWLVVPQSGQTFAERLVDGHRQAHRLAGGPVVQVGMDTPQAHAALLRGVADLAHDHGRPVLGPAVDGGWWVLVTTHPSQATVLAGVPMSRADTGRLTAAALEAAGYPPVAGPLLRDVDHVEDAEHVASAAPGTRFARLWREHAARRAASPQPDRSGS
ncbi:DUF2064 domain-containing protein [Phycicoccus sp. CSK15P-2]|uniref:TIGR04282 family arsenosugar biosynthesis glycosyltransferase n=1 Tax=Phycicoccus sp. CSK15P-2 TaxID=2807627 RepID=UPI00194F968B|nr:DUF2064 domain-containing protein [Phycicoccus sp. CSK15P-2]MBM6403366.1 DUF2064 domain-containing protein [Phycicoccus sp. CSK15P-2]